ncbi:hypothetical protein HUJ04_006190 [Dendroctonus ponderosae]|uniref:MORN repeat-containing protein 5 n=1 Tax=Dendroctonus ponderosae TaxID=77166 RepID=A0AAR5Q8D2_DENPD|nr:hypothetical protein HUJ04_006190 [Dendroctonus ponderosae]
MSDLLRVLSRQQQKNPSKILRVKKPFGYVARPKVRKTLTPDWDKVGLKKPSSVFCKRVDYFPGYGGLHPAQAEQEKPLEHFASGSSYEGSWNALGFAGFGTYVFPHGAIYEGSFRDGQFHGKGTITYPVGHKLKGYWKNGKLISQIFVFQDGLPMRSPWTYCQIPDRRFQIEANTDLRGPGEELQTNRQPTVDVPEGCFDTIDGFFVPGVNCIFQYDEEALANGEPAEHKQHIDSLKRTTLEEERDFIEENFRAAELKSVGYRPDLYEHWTTGREAEVEKVISEMGFEDASRASSTLLSDQSSSPLAPVNIEFTILR